MKRKENDLNQTSMIPAAFGEFLQHLACIKSSVRSGTKTLVLPTLVDWHLSRWDTFLNHPNVFFVAAEKPIFSPLVEQGGLKQEISGSVKPLVFR